MRDPWQISRRIGKFTFDIRVMGWLIVLALLYAAYSWLAQNPQHNPLAKLDLNDPVGLATNMKMGGVVNDRPTCLAAMKRSEVPFRTLTPVGEGACARVDRVQIANSALTPSRPVATCAVMAGFELWRRNGLQEAAEEHLGARVTRVRHLGTANCRRVANTPTAPWSEHATGNAIDVSGFVLSDGRVVDIRRHWKRGAKGEFLKAARTSACDSFRAVLSPDYNAAHADHFHLDQGSRLGTACR